MCGPNSTPACGDNRGVAVRGALRVGWLAAMLIALAGCGFGNEQPTATPDRVFTIVTPTPGTPGADLTGAERPARYTVKEGDMLSDIANDLGVSVTDLQDINGIEDPNNIFVGQVLVVPTAEP